MVMYNRYIPQPDGSYRRNQVPETKPRPTPSSPPHPKQEVHPTEPPTPRCNQSSHKYNRRNLPAPHRDPSVTGFLRRLLPRDFDTGDLIVVLLLLLMAGDCNEDQNTALLTLALYVFM